MEGKRDVKCPLLLFVFSMLRFVVHRNSICFVFFSSQVDSFICLEKKKKHLGSSAHASLPRRRCPPGRRSMWVRAIAVLAGSTAARLFVPPARPATVRAYVYSISNLARIFF